MKRTAWPCLLSLALVLAACGEDAAIEGSRPGPTFSVEWTVSGGPVSLVVRLTKAEIGLAETLILEEEVRAETGFEAELPEFVPEDLEGLGVVDIDEDPVEVRAGLHVRRRRLTLEPERSGVLTIPVREAWFHRAGEAAETSIASDPLEVTVLPIEDAESIELPAARTIMRPEDVLVADGASPWWWALLILPVLIAGVVVWRRRRRPEPPPRPAHELAWEALRRLAAQKLLEAGEVERFFVVLSAILREYVERRFGVRAPERTTREFLGEVASHSRLTDHRERLSAFLVLADRVKFARHEPEEARIQEAFDTTRAFVETTQEVGRA